MGSTKEPGYLPPEIPGGGGLMYISEKMVGAMVVWTMIALVVAYLVGMMLEVFLVLELIGLIIVREVLDLFTPADLKHRVDAFIFVGVLLFIGVVMRKVLLILEII
jgi:hypothetical protein